ncbi:MAG: hypothetical protein QOH12_3754 [Solirubrobacteraceae bacterium]|jgi:hypothetical protein|nr:hypothetical protein [Solirubrobacteraceae bacterium]
MVARHDQRRLESHDALADIPGTASTQRRLGLEENAAGARERLAAAHARRRRVGNA